MSLSVASNWLWNFGIGMTQPFFTILCSQLTKDVHLAYATPYLVDPTTYGINGVKTANLGVKVFFIWGSTCAGCCVFT